MRTNTTAAEATTTDTTTAQRLDMLTRISKPASPAKQGKIRLEWTLKENPNRVAYETTDHTLQVPAWLFARLIIMHPARFIGDFVQNAPYLSDPEHGPFTRARFIASFEEIMRFRELWADRDKGPTIALTLSLFTHSTAHYLYLAADFLSTSREILILAILTHAAMTRNPDAAPTWSDMANLQACQDEP